MNLLQQIEKEQLTKLDNGNVPSFSAGDTIRVGVKVKEGARERVQAFEGVCIARKNAGISSSFTVRKLSFGEGVERVFPLYSPMIDNIEVVRRGDVRRAKLYFLRGRTGKAARIKEDTSAKTLAATKAATAAAKAAKAKAAAAAAEAQPTEAAVA